MRPDVTDLLATMRVVALPLVTRFRGITVREAALFEGPSGWTEFAPFVEYDDAEAARWLSAAIEFGWSDVPPTRRSTIPVNATVPAVPAEAVADILRRFPGCRTAKVKVAGGPLADDVARVRAVRDELGDAGRVRVDANAAWTLEQAEHALRTLAPFGIEYAEQPCATVAELGALRERIAGLGVLIAADESIRRAADPTEAARVADVVIVKAPPLGGVQAAVDLVARLGLPAVVSSALDTSVGLAMGALTAAALPELPFACGLGTAALLAADVTDPALQPHDGVIDATRIPPKAALLDRWAADPDRVQWWSDRVRRCAELLP